MASNNLKIRNGKLLNKDSEEIINENGDLTHHNAHFKTNFSIDQKEDNEESYCDNQQVFQMIPYETKFNVINHTKTFLHPVDTFLIPPDSYELVYTGTWTLAGNPSEKFGESKFSGTIGNTVEFEFSGVSCFLAGTISSGLGTFKVELSNDGGSTWCHEKLITGNTTSAGLIDTIFDLYSGLDYGNYKVKVTVMLSANIYIGYVGYTTYVNQKSIAHSYWQASPGSKDIDDIPPTTTLITQTSPNLINSLQSSAWNSVFTDSGITGNTFEFRFYGSKIWVNIRTSVGTLTDMDIFIDDVQTNVKTTNVNYQPANGTHPVWFRLDNGILGEGWHVVKIVHGSSGGVVMSGWSWYSSQTISTVCRPVICGKNSYVIEADSTALTYNGGGWTITGSSTSFLQRLHYTTATNEYVEIITPNNFELQALHMLGGINTDGCEVKVELGTGTGGGFTPDSTKTRFFTQDSADYLQYSQIWILYDKNKDGDLHNKTIRITNNNGAATNYLRFEGLILEIGNPVEDDYIWCMPKWTQYYFGASHFSCVSRSFRMDVYGNKSDFNSGRQPLVHSGWCLIGDAQYLYFRHGLGIYVKDYTVHSVYNTTTRPSDGQGAQLMKVTDIEPGGLSGIGDPGLQGSYQTAGSGKWCKTIIKPHRVI